MSVKKSLKNQLELNPVKHLKNAAGVVKDDFTPDAPNVDTSAQEEALEQQRLMQAKLDEEENRRRKRLFAAATGMRAFTGSPMFRAAPGNTRGTAPSAGRPVTPRRARAPAGGGGNTFIP